MPVLLPFVAFEKDIELSPVHGEERLWYLDEDWPVTIDGQTVTVPKGFQTDLATTPRILWSFGFEPFGYWTEAAALHDFLYTAPHVPGIDREKADKVFRIGMLECGAPKWKAWVMWAAVRLFARSHWD